MDSHDARIDGVEVFHLIADGVDPALFDGSYETTICSVAARGTTGYGEAESLPAAVAALIDGPSAHSSAMALRDVLMGGDPLDTEGHFQRMYVGTEFVGRRGIAIHAIGALDIALWDLRGRLEGVPVHTLLGPQVRDRVPAYTSSFPTPTTEQDLQAQLRGFKQRGFRSFKLFVEPWWPERLEEVNRLLAVARAEAGSDGKVLVDGSLAYRDRATAHLLAGVFAQHGVDVFEAPLPLDDVTGHEELRQHGVPIGVGDLGLTHWTEWRTFVADARPDVLQPDPSVVGGITGMRRVAELATERGLALYPHGYKTRVTMAAGLQVLACQTGEVMIEYCMSPSPLIRDVTGDIGVDGAGYVHIPDGPGLGVDVDRASFARFAQLPDIP